LLVLIFWALGTQLLKTDGVIHLFLIIGIYASALAYTSERAWKKRKAQEQQGDSQNLATNSMVELTEVPDLLPRADDYSSRLQQLLPNNVAQSDNTADNQPSATQPTGEALASSPQNEFRGRHWLGDKVQAFLDRHPGTYTWVSFWILKKVLKFRQMESNQVEPVQGTFSQKNAQSGDHGLSMDDACIPTQEMIPSKIYQHQLFVSPVIRTYP
jgi:hypothetical protein